jgi:sugar O-acyltransferase (sialic acid O-acetyltransferase NeuD family)
MGPMKKQLIIFGNGDYAQIAYQYFSKDSDFEVKAFVVDRAFKNSDSFCGLDLITFDEVVLTYPSDKCYIFIALGYSNLNEIRKEKYYLAKALGYKLASYISPHARILDTVCIGENTFIFENNVIQSSVQIGSNVTLWSGNHIGHHTIIKDHCFIASQSVISGRVVLGEQCFVGVNATLRDAITVGDKCVIGAGSLLLRDAAANGVYRGHETLRSKIPSSRLKKI